MTPIKTQLRESLWRYKLVRAASWFLWGDHEYVRREWRWRYPWVFWLTIYEPCMRRGWRRLMPYRLRTAWADIAIDLLVRRCPGCEQRLTYRELVARDNSLVRYLSGTTWHRECCNSQAKEDRDVVS